MTTHGLVHVHVIGKRVCFAAGQRTNNYCCLLYGLSAIVKWLRVKTITNLFGVFNFFRKNKFWNPAYILTKVEFKFGKCSKLDFQNWNKILIKKQSSSFFEYIIIFRSTEMFAHIADLRLCALMSVYPHALAPYVGFRVWSLGSSGGDSKFYSNKNILFDAILNIEYILFK